MRAQSTERLAAGQKVAPGPGRQACPPGRADPISRQKASGFKNPPTAYIFVFLFSMICAFLDWTPVHASTLQLHVKDDLLSLEAADADLSAILQRLSEAAGIEFKFPKELERKITLQLSDVELEPALKKILKGLNYAVVYSVASSDDSISISAVYIYGKQKEGARGGQSAVSESGAQHSISDYEKRIRVVQQRLEKAGRDSQAGRQYQKEIEIYRRLIERLKIRGDVGQP